MIHVNALDVGIDPFLSIISALLVERKINGFIVLFVVPFEAELVILDVSEVFLGLLRSACAQSLVVLALPTAASAASGLPLVVFCLREEALLILAVRILLALFPDLDDWSHKLLQKTIQTTKGWPPVLHQIDQKTFDVRAVMILICHQHDGAIPQPTSGVVLSLDVKAHDFQQVLDLSVAGNLLEICISHVQNFALQREHPVLVPANYA
mmetsp:Transcript_76974/g.135672  ORF Transcript_76974/g.135672 Transcript_76974/m.135672 type:complete len:209 (-) Transcript_76974:846-1472(-)